MMGLGKCISGFISARHFRHQIVKFQGGMHACDLALYHLHASVAQRGMAPRGLLPWGDAWR